MRAIPYFAYGSNLAVKDLLERAPASQKDVTAVLPDWRLTFRGVADIEPAEGENVYGAIWWIDARGVRNLDMYEGAPRYYEQRIVEVQTAEGPRQAMTYVMTPDSQRYEVGLPSKWYYDTIARGFEDWGMDDAPLRRALRRVFDELDDLQVSYFRADGDKRLRAVIEEPYIDDEEVVMGGMSPATRSLMELPS